MAVVAAPLVSEARILGVITLLSFDGREINQRDLRLLTAVAGSIAGALEQARLHEDLRRADEARRMLLARLVAAQEDERARIAADIHDDSIQIMSAVNLRLGLLRRSVTDPDEARSLERLENTVRLAVARLRHLLFELRPPALDHEGLGPAVHTVLEQLEEQFDLVGHLENKLRNEPPDQARIVLYRIAQEAMTNVRKHAQARHVEVILESTDGGARVRVRDDGIGFSADDTDRPEPGHLGLTSMRERAEMAGGWFRVKSEPGSGTEVDCWVPVPEMEPARSAAS
jgi:signal transduction histidine kinase